MLRANGVIVQERQPPGKWEDRSSRLLSKLFQLEFINRELNYFSKFKPDLVCVSNGSAMCGIAWLDYCKRAGIPCVSLIESNGEYWWPDDCQSIRMIELYENLYKVYFVSEGNHDLFERQLGIRLENAEIVRNPFGVSWNSPCIWPEDSVLRLACIGRLEPAAKGQDLLFRVLAMPKWKERPISVSLFGTGPCEQGLRRLAETEGITSQVRFAGHVSGVEEIWGDHHALILPSRYEGLPLVVVEAMLSNRPVITTDVAGNKELLLDNLTGFIAAAPTVFHLDEAMERAWQRRKEWGFIGRAAGEAARCILPENPAQLFADKLLDVARSCLLAK